MLDRLTIERMRACVGDSPILVALSGGGDSTALLHLLTHRFGAAPLRAIVIDHALREGSAPDARRAHASAHALGVASQIVTLSWPHGANPSQQSARQARYRALCAAARDEGARAIALGHTADDQAETVFMRAGAGSSWRGLAGMAPIAPAPAWPEGRGIIVARPLLGVRREPLRAFLRSRQGVWIEDPANANPLYERVRVRARLASLEAAGLDPMRIARLGKHLRSLADVVDRDAAALIARAASFEADRIVVAPRQWNGGASARRRALSALIAAAAGAEREPAASAVERLEERLLDANFTGASLGGAGIAVVGHTIVLDRDRGALEGRADGARPMAPLALPSGVETVWDGRLLLKASGPGVSVWADPPAPRLVNDIEHDPPVAVETRWLLSERAAHALRVGVHDG